MGIRRIVKLSFDPEKCQAFEAKFSEIKERIGSQKGCSGVKLLKAKGEENVYFTLSDWEEDQDLENYRQSEFFEEVWSEVKQWFDARPEAWSTEIIVDNKEG